ncbi:hypothetical protein J27TS7_00140 [Paenibacillus dendritiformis]|uniref:MerR family transcriptional regulator n=1 Tax=Paenibacillus dendritiformis TaxID=130049 RepID=UPI001B1264E5|nr:MerR family transcriptional regulator [Paenibacillus dendritiformis]GIO70500.1 hypothetical protein J27TS7_00140 [Paenibacillus dendritiformis]
MRISELSRLTGVSIRSLRYYEDKGLLAPSRTDSGYRVYGEEDVERVRQIQFYLHMGVHTEELASLFQRCAGFPGNGEPACAEEAIAFYERKLRDIRRQKRLLEQAEQDICGMLEHWTSARNVPVGRRGTEPMLRLDHVTLAVRDLDAAVEQISRRTGARFARPVEAFPGAQAQVAYFGAGFLEVIAIAEPDKLRATPLGRAFAAFAESREGIFGVALEITGGMTAFVEEAKKRGAAYVGPWQQQAPLEDGSCIPFGTAFLRYDMPWLIEYERSRTWDSPLRLCGVDVAATDPLAQAGQYRQAYRLAEPASIGAYAYEWELDRGKIRLLPREKGQPAGFAAVLIGDAEREYRIGFTPESGMEIAVSPWAELADVD